MSGAAAASGRFNEGDVGMLIMVLVGINVLVLILVFGVLSEVGALNKKLMRLEARLFPKEETAAVPETPSEPE